MKKFMFVSTIVFVLFMVACASVETKSSEGEWEDDPCAKELANAGDSFTSSSSAVGARARASEVKRIALNKARVQMAENMKGAYRGMVSNYLQEMGLNDKTDIEEKLEAAGDQIVDTFVGTTQPICVKTRKIDEGQIETYVGLKTLGVDVAKKLVAAASFNLTEDERNKINFDEEQYRKKMEGTFDKYNAEKQAKKEEFDKKQEEKKEEK